MSSPAADLFLTQAMDAHRRGDTATAERGYRAALKSNPRSVDALHLLGTIVAQQNPDGGIDLINQSLTLAPQSKEAHFNIANIFARVGRMADAERHFRATLKLDPTNAIAANGLGGALLHQGHLRDAEQQLHRALELTPNLPNALINLGMVKDAQDQRAEALALYDRAVQYHPQHPEAHQHRAMALLARGQLAEGWVEYAWRVAAIATLHGRLPFPHWSGEPLTGRKILVWTEQGLGEEILVASMIPDLLAQDARIVLVCSPRLTPVFAHSFPDVQVIPLGQTPDDTSILSGIDFQASFSDLGRFLRPTLDAFPRRAPFLRADTARARALREKYRADDKSVVVGLSWRSAAAGFTAAKSTDLRAWVPLLETPGVTFVSLQYGDTAQEIAEVHRAIGLKVVRDADIDPLVDMEGFTAQVAAMDIVISVSNTTAHVAGALNRPTWVLMPSHQGRLWYWFLDRPDSPWYPSARLFRTGPGEGWQRPLTKAAAALQAFMRAGAPPHVFAP